jgi:hypothetical protein
MSEGPTRRRFLIHHAPGLVGLAAIRGTGLFSTDLWKTDPSPQVRHTTTDWRVKASFGFDTLCFLNTLSGDPFYTASYKDDFARFSPQITPDARRSLASLKKQIKDDGGGIISAFLCTTFSVIPVETLDDLIDGVNQPDRIRALLEPTPYYSKAGWQQFLAVRSDLGSIFRFLKSIQFENYWRTSILPRIQQRISVIEPELRGYNVVAEDEAVLGAALPSNQITVYVLQYNHPHGIRLTGTRFVSGLSWPLPIVVNNAAHELLHPPYDLAHDRELRETLATLKGDAFLMRHVTKHNPSFGYNSLESLVEEDCVRALDQLVMEKLTLARDPRERWKDEDEGMHVFAVALYSVMQQERYAGSSESFRDFLVRMVRSGTLAPGRIEPLHAGFFKSRSPGAEGGR